MTKTAKQILILLVSLLSTHSFAAPTGKISDSLVENLACDRISTDEIYRRIRPESLGSSYHTLSVNWPFSAGLYDLAACWSLSRTQRLFFYLSRWNQHSDPTPQQTTEILDMVRGSRPYASGSGLKETALSEFKVFSQKDSQWRTNTPLWSQMQYGFSQKFSNGKTMYRAWKHEIEHYQKERFHEFAKNLKFVIGDDARSGRKNRQTRDVLLRNLESHRLTLLLLRPTRTAQHIVVAKSFEIKNNGRIEIRVYDSNQPLRDQIVVFDGREDDFYAPDIVRGLPRVKNANDAIGVFIVDEYERSLVDTALLKHYKKACSAPTGT